MIGRSRRLASLPLIAVVLLLAACGGGSGPPPPTIIPTVTVESNVNTLPSATVAAVQTQSSSDLATAAASEQARAAGGSSVDPCAFITAAAMSEILGMALTGPAVRSPDLPMLCTYSTEEYDLGLFVGNSADLSKFGFGNSAAESFASRQADAENAEDYQEISDLGDEAFSTPGAMTVLAGDYLILINSGSIEAERNIAEKVMLGLLPY